MGNDNSFDVIVIGGGVIGLAVARALRGRGVDRVAVVERGAAGREASFAAAGMLAPDVECVVPDAFHRFCSESGAMYPAFAAQLFEETGIDIELDRTGTLYLALTEADSKELHERYACQKRAGIAVERLSAAETHRREPHLSPDVRESLYYPNDWQVENRKLVAALLMYCETNNVRVFEKERVVRIPTEKTKIDGVTTENGTFQSYNVVIAAGAWTRFITVGNSPSPVNIKPIRGQLIAYRSEAEHLRHVTYTTRGYLVPRADGRLLVGATVEDEGFNNSVTEQGKEQLRSAAEEILPQLGDLDIVEQWSGLRPYAPPHGWPVIGPLAAAEGLMIAAGHYRNGILLAPITAEIIASNIVDGCDSEYFTLFGPESSSGTVSGGQT